METTDALVFLPPAEEATSICAVARQGASLIDAARHEACEVLSHAQTEAETLRKNGFTAGFEQGRTEALTRMLGEIATEQKVLLNAAATMAELCTVLCKQVIGAELQFQPNSIAGRIQRALSTIPLASRITLQANPQDIEYLIAAFAENGRCELAHQAAPKIVGVQCIPQGSARIVSEYGTVECNIRQHFTALQNQLNALCLELLQSPVLASQKINLLQ